MFAIRIVFFAFGILSLNCISKALSSERFGMNVFEFEEHKEEYPFSIAEISLGITDWNDPLCEDLKKIVIHYFKKIDLPERNVIIPEIEYFSLLEKNIEIKSRLNFLSSLFSILREYDIEQKKKFLRYLKKISILYADEDILFILNRFHLFLKTKIKKRLFNILMHVHTFLENGEQHHDSHYNPLCLSPSDTSSTQSTLTMACEDRHAHRKNLFTSVDEYLSFLRSAYNIPDANFEKVLYEVLSTLEQWGASHIQSFDKLITFSMKKYKKFSALEMHEIESYNKIFYTNIKLIKSFCHFSTLNDMIFEAALNLTFKKSLCRNILFDGVRKIINSLILKPDEQIILIYALIHVDVEKYEDFKKVLIKLERKGNLDFFTQYINKKRLDGFSFCFEDFIESMDPPVEKTSKKKIKIKKVNPNDFHSSFSTKQNEQASIFSAEEESSIIIEIPQTIEEKMKSFLDAEIKGFENYYDKQHKKNSSFFSCCVHQLSNEEIIEKYVQKSIFLKLNPSFLDQFKSKIQKFLR